MKPSARPAWLLASLVCSAASVASPVDTPERLGVAVSAEVGCASIFLMQRSVQSVETLDIHPLVTFTQDVSLRVDPKMHTVTASTAGASPRTALYRPGVGCTLLNDASIPSLLSQTKHLSATWAPREPSSVPLPRSSTVPEPVAVAVTRLFDELNHDGLADTRAVIVVKDGKVLAERYAPGFNAQMPFLGWSASKSLMNALVGILVADGRLKLDDPAPVPQWSNPSDPRHAITLRQLLQMSSGLAFAEPYVPGSDSINMLFASGSMAAYAAAKPLSSAPGTVWAYSSGTTNIVGRIVFDAAGGSAQDFTRFARSRLFGPAGMSSAVFELDESGSPVASSLFYATARDWARFGLLYLQQGRADGHRVLPASWIDFTRSPAPANDSARYGAQFWLNWDPTQPGQTRDLPHCPPDTYLAHGFSEQIVAIVPSKNAVIVRLGWTPYGKHIDLDKYVCGIATAL